MLLRSRAKLAAPPLAAMHGRALSAPDPKTQQVVRGVCSNYLADVKPGDELVMTGAGGDVDGCQQLSMSCC